MKKLLAFLLLTVGLFAAENDLKIQQQSAAGSWPWITVTGTPNYVVGFNGSGQLVSKAVTATPGGSSGDLQFNNAGSFGGITPGTGVVTALGNNVGSAGGPVVFNGALGTPSSGVATNLTGTAAGLTAGTANAVAVGGITGLGTGVGAALAVNVGSAGAPVLFNGAGGTPSSLTLTSATGLPLSTGVTGDLPFANLTQIAGLSVLGVTGNSTADVAAITAGSDNQVFRRSGTSLAFGAINLASSSAVTGAVQLTNGGTGASLSDPDADRIPFWDDSLGAVTWLTVGSGLSISGTTITADASNAVTAASAAAGAGLLWVSAGADRSAEATDTVDAINTTDLAVTNGIDAGAASFFEIPNGASPTTDAFGEIAGDNDAWAASRGAGQFFDGTANTYLVGVLASDTPSNGQVPKWNTGGTITWEDDSGGSASLTATRVGYGDGSNLLTGEAAFTYDATNDTMTVGGLILGGNRTKAAWTTTGIVIAQPAATYTDSSSSGTVAAQAINNIAAPTVAASSSTTFTDSFTLRIAGPPANGTNVTQIRPHSLGILDSTSASSSSTQGAFVVATAFGTSATSVAIGAGYVYSGTGLITDGTIACAGNQSVGFNGRSAFRSDVDAQFRLCNNANNGSAAIDVDFAVNTNSGSGFRWGTGNTLTVQSAAATTTFNDAATAGSGTVANRYVFGVDTPAFSATNSSVTNTIASTLWIGGEPTAGTNVTNTNSYAFYIAGGDVRWAGYGAGTLTTDANGVITATSDGRMKEVQGEFSRGLESIKALNSIRYKWKAGLGLDTEHEYTGFIAQDVQAVIPEAVGQDKEGHLTLADRPIIAALVNAVKELDARAPADWLARGMAAFALILAVRANTKRK